jgi:hypothetical protein
MQSEDEIMKKVLTVIFFLVMICMLSISQAQSREIQVSYINGLRIPCHEIKIEIKENINGGCTFHVTMKQMEGQTGFEDKNKDFTVKIERDYFEKIYDRLIKLNYKEIIENNNDSIGLDGTSVDIKLSGYLADVSIDVWSPDYDTEERKLSELNQVIKDIFTKAGILEWY